MAAKLPNAPRVIYLYERDVASRSCITTRSDADGTRLERSADAWTRSRGASVHGASASSAWIQRDRLPKEVARAVVAGPVVPALEGVSRGAKDADIEACDVGGGEDCLYVERHDPMVG